VQKNFPLLQTATFDSPDSKGSWSSFRPAGSSVRLPARRDYESERKIEYPESKSDNRYPGIRFKCSKFAHFSQPIKKKFVFGGYDIAPYSKVSRLISDRYYHHKIIISFWHTICSINCPTLENSKTEAMSYSFEIEESR